MALELSLVNSFLAYKQHLLPPARLGDLKRVISDLVALHATNPTGPYLSLWARMHGFQRADLEEALYQRRRLVRLISMRRTLHVVGRDEFAHFFQAYADQWGTAERRSGESLLVQAGLGRPGEAARRLEAVHRRVMEVLARRGPSTVREIGQQVPELTTKVLYSPDKPYSGEFSLGSRLVPGMCALGLLVRSRPRGTWRSNLYQYASLDDWLPGLRLDSIEPPEARTWLARRYLAAFGPVTFEDLQWWTGFTKRQTRELLEAIKPVPEEVTVEGVDHRCLMVAGDAERLCRFRPPVGAYVFFLPALDPYIMGYRERGRFLTPEHTHKVFDRAGNAMPTVWANGRVAGAWGQRKDGSVVYRLFDLVGAEENSLLEEEKSRLERFLGGEFLAPRTQTSFTRELKG